MATSNSTLNAAGMTDKQTKELQKHLRNPVNYYLVLAGYMPKINRPNAQIVADQIENAERATRRELGCWPLGAWGFERSNLREKIAAALAE
jgi:hypothetical protein